MSEKTELALQIGKTSFEKGLALGEQKMVLRLLQNRFGTPNKGVRKRVASLSEEELLALSGILLDPAVTLVDLGLEDADSVESPTS